MAVAAAVVEGQGSFEAAAASSRQSEEETEEQEALQFRVLIKRSITAAAVAAGEGSGQSLQAENSASLEPTGSTEEMEEMEDSAMGVVVAEPGLMPLHFGKGSS